MFLFPFVSVFLGFMCIHTYIYVYSVHMYPTRFGRIRWYDFYKKRRLLVDMLRASGKIYDCVSYSYNKHISTGFYTLLCIPHIWNFVESLDLQTCFSMHAIEVPILLWGLQWKYQTKTCASNNSTFIGKPMDTHNFLNLFY